MTDGFAKFVDEKRIGHGYPFWGLRGEVAEKSDDYSIGTMQGYAGYRGPRGHLLFLLEDLYTSLMN